MLDGILAFLSMFDWITPTAAYVQDLVHGPSRQFHVPFGHGWSGHNIRKLLNNYGIESYGFMIVDDTIVFTVGQAQTEWAAYVLEKSGVPLGPGQIYSLTGPRSTIGPLGALSEWRQALTELFSARPVIRSIKQAPNKTFHNHQVRGSNRPHSTTTISIEIARDTQGHKTSEGRIARSALGKPLQHDILYAGHGVDNDLAERNSDDQSHMVADRGVREHLSEPDRTVGGVGSERRTIV